MKIHPFLMLLAAATMAAPVLSAATLTHTEDGSATWTRGSIISLNVTSTTGLVITDISHVTRGDDVLRDFFLYYRAGAFDLIFIHNFDLNIDVMRRQQHEFHRIGMVVKICHQR